MPAQHGHRKAQATPCSQSDIATRNALRRAYSLKPPPPAEGIYAEEEKELGQLERPECETERFPALGPSAAQARTALGSG